MLKSITVRIPEKLQKQLQEISKKEHIPVSNIIRESLREYIAVNRFRKLRKDVLPFAKNQGILTDEDVFRVVS